MATLIGDGAHAGDILPTLGWRVRRFPHHKAFRGRVSRPFLIGINDPWLRAEVAEKLGIEDDWWVHPEAMVTKSCTLGYGTHANYGATMTRTMTGHHCTISPGVTICGDVTIGDRVLIGAGATICDRVTIGSDVTIGAGAVVLPEAGIQDGQTWVGVPAQWRR